MVLAYAADFILLLVIFLLLDSLVKPKKILYILSHSFLEAFLHFSMGDFLDLCHFLSDYFVLSCQDMHS